jgi:DNA-binding HxlR family transcriptional regulator
MPGKTDFSDFNCSLARALGAVGDWWTLLILRETFFGARRFSDFQRSLGIARNILAARLDALTKSCVLAREGTARRPIYRLTAKGEELLPALVALMQWGDKWESEDRPPVLLSDDRGRPLKKIALTSQRGTPVTAASIRFAPGPGANAATRQYLEAMTRPGKRSS